MALAADFKQLLDTLPADWTDLEFDLRIDNEDEYVEAATLLTQCNAQPYSRADLSGARLRLPGCPDGQR